MVSEVNEVLLVTAAINVESTPYISIRDKKERLLQYLTSLVAWIKLTNINTIVFCENTATDYDFQEIVEFAKSEGKTLEILIFNGNKKAQKYGKGYGEGEIIEYAIQHSYYLRNKVSFYKITGRLFIPEFDRIYGLHSNLANVFKTPAFTPDPWSGIGPLKPDNPVRHLRAVLRYLYVFFGRGRGRGPHQYDRHISTIFYKSNVEFFKKHLIRSYKRVNDAKNYALEHTYYEDLSKHNFSPFLTNYTIMGKCGTTGSLYCGQDYPEFIQTLAATFL